MGVYGPYFDENDDAADWLEDFADAPDWQRIDEALAVIDADYLEAPEAAQALAAAEIVAAALGKPSPRLDIEVADWAAEEEDGAKERRQSAILALDRVREDSELQELWQDADEYSVWLASINETMARL